MIFTEKQQQIIDGSLLGDASIWTNYTSVNKKFTKGQSKSDWVGEDKESYMDWHMKMFYPFSSSVKPSSFIGVGGKTYHKYTFTTHMDEVWEKVDVKWYRKDLIDDLRYTRTKIVPTDIKLTPLALCVWHMDDGSNNQTDANIELNTQSFTVEEVEFLIERLKQDLGIDSHKKTGGKKEGQYKIYVGRGSYFDFIEMIKPHVEWDCFKYKLDTSGYTKQPHRGELHSGSILTELDVREIFTCRNNGMKQKDIAKKMGVSNISAILSGEQWSHLGLSMPKVKKPRLSKEVKQQIADLQTQGCSQNQIAERLNINQSTVSRVLRGA